MTRAAKILEARLEASLRVRVRSRLGGMVIKLYPAEKGVPDRLVLVPGGHMYLVELKTDVGELSALQEHWHGRARDLGTDVVVLRGVEQIDAWVRRVAEAIVPPHLRDVQRSGPKGPRRVRHTDAHELEAGTTDDGRTLLTCTVDGCTYFEAPEEAP